jgi:hypothetical protein
MNESSITHSHLVHKGGMSPPLDDEDSVEIDLNAIGLPPQKITHAQSTRDGIYISESRMNPELKKEMV